MVFGKNETDPLDYDAVIVDEASMVDLLLMQGLLKALKLGTRLVLVGDADQLPSVGAGNVLADILRSDYIHAVRLKEIFRQAQESLIIVNAHRIDHGEYPSCNEKGGDFFMMERGSEEDIRRTILELVKDRLPAHYALHDPLQDIQVITPAKKRGLGTIRLNELLQQTLNPPAPGLHEIEAGCTRLKLRAGRSAKAIRSCKTAMTICWPGALPMIFRRGKASSTATSAISPASMKRKRP